jgi:hypothetical protein
MFDQYPEENQFISSPQLSVPNRKNHGDARDKKKRTTRELYDSRSYPYFSFHIFHTKKLVSYFFVFIGESKQKRTMKRDQVKKNKLQHTCSSLSTITGCGDQVIR